MRSNNSLVNEEEEEDAGCFNMGLTERLVVEDVEDFDEMVARRL